MPFFRAFAETRIGGGPLKRFLLDTDIGPIAGQPATIVNYLDLDGVGPQPDLQVRVIIYNFNKPDTSADGTRRLSDTRLEIRLQPMDGRVLTNVEIRVFVNTSDLVFPLGGPPTPDPSTFIFIGYRGAAGQNMPTSLSAWLSQRQFRAGANDADPFTDDDIDIVVQSTPVAAPLHLEGGILEGTVSLKQAVETSFAGSAYSEKAPVDIRTMPLEAPSATIAQLSVSTPAVSTFPLDCLWLGIATDHTIDAPTPPPLAALAAPGGPGNVDRGAHRYRVSYVLQNGKETKAGPPSVPVTVTDPAANGRVRLSAIPLGPPPPINGSDPGVTVVARRIYRTVASASGDDGEYFLAFEIPDNLSTDRIDDVADAALGATAPDRLVVHYSSTLSHHIDGSLRLRDAGIEDRYDPVELRNVPTEARVRYTTRPDPGRPRVRWQADAILASARVVLPTLRSGALQWGEARARRLPQFLGVHWAARGSTRSVIEIGGDVLGTPASSAVGTVEALLASMQRPWRDAPQAVCVEYVSRALPDGRVIDARTRVAARELHRARVAFGEVGPRHARADDGIKLEVSLGRERRDHDDRRRVWRRGRALRALILTDSYAGGVRTHQHLALRAVDLPNELNVDLRSSPDSAAGGAYFGLHVIGILERLKVLSLSDPTAQAAAYAADSLRLWLALPRTPEELDVVRAGMDALLTLSEPIFAEASVRDPRGFDAGADPLRHLKAAVAAPASIVHLGPPAIAFGTATGSTIAVLNDPGAAFDAAMVGRSVRYLSGPNAGVRRAIRTFTNATSLTTDGFPAAPVDGDRYAIEALVFGTATGGTADTLNDPNAAFDAALVSSSVRYLTGANAGAQRRITAVTSLTSLTTEAFASAPADGDPYAIDALGGIEVDTALDSSGLTARVAATKDLDSMLSVRATPQIRLRTAPVGSAPGPVLRAATGRVYGVRAFSLASSGAGALAVPVLLDPGRVNTALRAYVRELDTRFAAAERDLLKARVEALPPEVGVRADLSIPMFGARLSARSGPGAFWMEPGQMRAGNAGSRAGQAAGIGLVEFQIDGIPRAVRFTVLGAAQFPPNFPAPDGNWHGGGISAEVSEMASIDFLRMISWGRDHRDDLNQIFWSRIDATFVRWNQDAPTAAPAAAVLVPISIWMPGEIDPDDEDDPESGIGYRIPTPGATVTLDIDVYEKVTNQANVRWVDLPGAWDLQNELQMKNYAGEVTVASPLGASPAGDDDAGPGQWFLRVIDGRPWYIGAGSAYFGNTGGWIASRPRIFA